MSVTIDAESIARGVSISWEVAHKADGWQDWQFRWAKIGAELAGVWDAVNYGAASRDAIDDVLADIQTLRAVARYHAHIDRMANFE
jgi:hypothetical protein